MISQLNYEFSTWPFRQKQLFTEENHDLYRLVRQGKKNLRLINAVLLMVQSLMT